MPGQLRSEQLEDIRHRYEAFNAGDDDAALAGFDPEIEFFHPPELPGENSPYKGLGGVRRAIDEQREVFDRFQLLPHDMSVVGADSVVVRVTVAARSRTTGIEVGARNVGHLFTFRGDRCVRWEVFATHGRAMREARARAAARPQSGERS